jgi:hypothetical protein
MRSPYIIVHDSWCDRLSCILTLPQRHRSFSLINQKDGDLINQKDGDRTFKITVNCPTLIVAVNQELEQFVRH